MPVVEKVIDNFPNGIIDTIANKDIPDGAASKALNWMTFGDHIELRRGQIAVGTESTSAGKITGLYTAIRADGSQVTFRKNGQKLEYFIAGVSSDWAETGSNIFGSAAQNDDASFAAYTTNAGNQMFICTPNAGPFKIMLANPGDYKNLYDSTLNFQGRIKITQNRMLLFGRSADKTGVYGGYIDQQDYHTITDEVYGSGDGSTTVFSHSAGAPSSLGTTFGIVIAVPAAATAISAITQANPAQITANGHGLTSGQSVVLHGIGGMTALNDIPLVATVIDANNFTVAVNTTGYPAYTSGGNVNSGFTNYTDDFNGNITGAAGSGTANYTTGAMSLTLNVAPVNHCTIYVSYQWENCNLNGITVFVKSSPRKAGEGFIFRQDEEGADMEYSFTYNGHEYCFHKKRTWDLNISNDDTQASNLPYRARIGISNWRNGIATGTGVYYINDVDANNIKLEKIALNQFSTDVIPSVLSKRVTDDAITLGVILDGFSFDHGAMIEYGDLILIACRTTDSTTNNRVIIYNKLTGAIDYTDYTVSCFAINNSELWAGDSTSPNVYKILNGFDDNNSNIPNYWEGKEFPLFDYYLGKCRKLVLQGLISKSQSYNVLASIDDSDYVQVGTISGTGAYVDAGQSVSVTIGYGSIGSSDVGGNSMTVDAYNYEYAIPLKLGKFVRIRLRFEATGSGYVSISQQRFWDLAAKSLKPLKKYS